MHIDPIRNRIPLEIHLGRLSRAGGIGIAYQHADAEDGRVGATHKPLARRREFLWLHGTRSAAIGVVAGLLVIAASHEYSAWRTSARLPKAVEIAAASIPLQPASHLAPSLAAVGTVTAPYPMETAVRETPPQAVGVLNTYTPAGPAPSSVPAAADGSPMSAATRLSSAARARADKEMVILNEESSSSPQKQEPARKDDRGVGTARADAPSTAAASASVKRSDDAAVVRVARLLAVQDASNIFVTPSESRLPVKVSVGERFPDGRKLVKVDVDKGTATLEGGAVLRLQ